MQLFYRVKKPNDEDFTRITKPLTRTNQNSLLSRKNTLFEETVNSIVTSKDNEVTPANDLFLKGQSKLDMEFNASKRIRFDKIDLDLVQRFSPRQTERIIND